MMASKSGEKMPDLPRGWSRHVSNSCPGRYYYFNTETGAKTWDIRDIISGKDLPMEASNKDINDLSIHELEKLLEEKKKRERLEKQSASSNKRKSSESIDNKRKNQNSDVLNPKRKKIAIDIHKNKGTQKTIQYPQVKEKEPDGKKSTSGRSKWDRGADKSQSSDEEDSFDLDKLTKRNTNSPQRDEPTSSRLSLAPNHSSSPKRIQKSGSIEPPNHEGIKKLSSNDSSSPIRIKKSKKNRTVNDSDSPIRIPKKSNSNGTDSSNRDLYQYNRSYLPENYGTRYENYKNEEKDCYSRRKLSAPPKHSGFKPKPNPSSSTNKNIHQQQLTNYYMEQRNPGLEIPNFLLHQNFTQNVDVTPDHDADVTPVYGDLDDSYDQDLPKQSVPYQRRVNEKVGSNSHDNTPKDETNYHVPIPHPVTPRDPSNESVEEVSFEGERPPTPTLVKELQEEESMEWESIDMEEVLHETLKVRDMVCQAMDCEIADHDPDSHEDTKNDHEEKGVVSKSMVVVDTNVFVSNLSLINRLMEVENVMVVIPWMVVQELDGLKESEKQKTSVGARAAVRWINKVLLEKNENLITETNVQSRNSSKKFDSKSPDDKILATCLQLKEECNKVVLATNDVNLANKALINQIKTGNSEKVIDVINNKDEKEESFYHQNVDINSNDIKNLVDQARDCLRDVLEEVLKKEFCDAYGDTWEKIVSIKPQQSRPHWSLGQLFTLYSKHHIAVFGLSFPRNGNDLKLRLEIVKEKLGSLRLTNRLLDVKICLAEIEKLFEVLKQKDEYDGAVGICSEKVNDILKQIDDFENEAKASTKYIIDAKSVDDDGSLQNVQDLFQNVWEIIASFTRGFATCLGVPTDIPPMEPHIQFNSKANAFSELPSFLNQVNNLAESMVNAVNIKDELSLGTFFDQLTNFRSNLDLSQSYWPLTDTLVTRRHLSLFLMRPANHELINNGLNQICTFRQTLVTCSFGSNNNM